MGITLSWKNLNDLLEINILRNYFPRHLSAFLWVVFEDFGVQKMPCWLRLWPLEYLYVLPVVLLIARSLSKQRYWGVYFDWCAGWVCRLYRTGLSQSVSEQACFSWPDPWQQAMPRIIPVFIDTKGL